MARTVALHAISEHVELNGRLELAVYGSGETFQAAELAGTAWCGLGQWLEQQRQQDALPTDLVALFLEHAAYHRCLGQVADTINRGDLAAAAEAILAGGDLHVQWSTLQAALLHLLVRDV